jgi:tRNA 5-methylaminomethyl-2-thiouridine biosynthesis bifunctional protein
VIVHGSGIGGACMARQLADQGLAVQVFDPGNPTNPAPISAAVLHARLLGDGSAGAQFRHSSYHYATSCLKRLAGYQQTGALQLQGPNLNAKKLDRITAAYGAQQPEQRHWLQRVDAETASELSGLCIDQDSLYFPAAAVVNLPQLCSALLEHKNIAVVRRAAEFDKQALNVLCTAGGTRSFPGCEHLEISQIHGQLDYFDSNQLQARLPVVGNGYLVPTQSGCVLGASYEYTPWPADKARAHNEQINQHLTQSADLTWLSHERGVRAVSSDRMPLIGCLDTEQPLWIATAFGSLGTSAAPLAAAMLASQILGWMPPVSAEVENLTDPNRFARRQARRGIRHR